MFWVYCSESSTNLHPGVNVVMVTQISKQKNERLIFMAMKNSSPILGSSSQIGFPQKSEKTQSKLSSSLSPHSQAALTDQSGGVRLSAMSRKGPTNRRSHTIRISLVYGSNVAFRVFFIQTLSDVEEAQQLERTGGRQQGASWPPDPEEPSPPPALRLSPSSAHLPNLPDRSRSLRHAVIRSRCLKCSPPPAQFSQVMPVKPGCVPVMIQIQICMTAYISQMFIGLFTPSAWNHSSTLSLLQGIPLAQIQAI